MVNEMTEEGIREYLESAISCCCLTRPSKEMAGKIALAAFEKAAGKKYVEGVRGNIIQPNILIATVTEGDSNVWEGYQGHGLVGCYPFWMDHTKCVLIIEIFLVHR